jgi:lysozyme
MSEIGLDFSHYQGSIDWAKVRKAGYTYAIGKVTEGANFVDSTWARNLAGALAAGITLGGYHWLKPKDDLARSVDLYLSHLAWRPGMLPIVLDVEHRGGSTVASNDGASPDQIRDYILAFVDKVAHVAPVMIYTGTWFWNPYVSDDPRFHSMPYWHSRYASTIGALPKSWTTAAIWQHSDHGSVPGVPGPVDLDVTVSQSIAQLVAYAQRKPTTQPADYPTSPTKPGVGAAAGTGTAPEEEDEMKHVYIVKYQTGLVAIDPYLKSKVGFSDGTSFNAFVTRHKANGGTVDTSLGLTANQIKRIPYAN